MVNSAWKIAWPRLTDNDLGCTRDRISTMQWIVGSGQETQGRGCAGRTREWPATRARWRPPRWHHRAAGTAHTWWHHFPVAFAPAGDEHVRWHSYRGALRGVSPRTREGRNGPTVPTAEVSGQRSVVSGQWSVTAGGGYDLVAARGMGACIPILGGTSGPAIHCQQSVERVMPAFCSAWACLKRASAILVIRSVSAYKVMYILRSPPQSAAGKRPAKGKQP